MSRKQAVNDGELSDPNDWIDRYGGYLFKYALLRLQDPELAEDLIQEALLAALQARQTFTGRSSEKTWLVGILKHKIIDHIRRVSRRRTVGEVELSPAELERSFDPLGHWAEGMGPIEWGKKPDLLFEQKEFWGVLEQCLSQLSPRQARAFTLREMDGLSSQEICKVLNVSATNLWVMLHRARKQLRNCLDLKWFGQKRAET